MPLFRSALSYIQACADLCLASSFSGCYADPVVLILIRTAALLALKPGQKPYVNE